jgi:ferritin-like metal-binding protein YciE
MMSEKGRELLKHGLRDMYDAEHRFVDALETMIEQVTDESLGDGFQRHLKQTKEQIRRLDRCFDELDETPRREDCPGSKGLIAEYQKFVKEQRPDAATLDTFAAEAGLKVEYYEIVSYRSLINLADFCGYDACAKLLKKNLVEEEQAAAELTGASEKLAAKLTGASGAGVVRRAAGVLLDQVREGTFVATGTAKSVGEFAAKRASDVVEEAEKRGRRAVRSAQARGRAARSTTRRKPVKGRARTTAARKITRKTTRSTNGRRRTPTTRGRTTARKTTGRRSTARRTGTRSTSRTGKARSRSRS